MRKKTNALFTIIVCVGMMLSACNFPFLSSATEEASPEPGSAADQTSVAETVVALQTQESGLPADEETEEPVGEESPEPPTEEAGPSPTPGEEGCIDRVGFVADVTIPDDTFIDPGDSFTKTWRLKNLGTCTWTSSYALVFSHGDQMGGPGSVPLSGTVNPGGTVDLSVNLTAPGSEGTYQGYWMLRNGSGVLFGIGGSGDSPFWVKIKVPGPTPTPTSTGLILVLTPIIVVPFPTHLTRVAGESGMVWSDGTVYGPENAGDTGTDLSSQAFLSFNISTIPAGSTINSVTVDFTDYDTLGDPFGSLGCLRGYVDNYGTLDSSDYHSGGATGAIMRWCNASQLSTAGPDEDVVNALQSVVGSSRFRLRMQFNQTATDNDGVADMVRLGDVKLIISYTAP
jgi:hypothetical protein